MKTKHTPGPWRVNTRGQYNVEDESGRLVASCGGYSDTRTDPEVLHNEKVANARLIAAASELLEALETLVFLHDCEQEGIACGQPTAKQWIRAVEAAQKAINKAKGE